MDIEEALELFGISDLNLENAESLRKTYRKLMKKNHPDNHKGNESLAKDITLAYEMLKKVIKQVEQLRKIEEAHREYSIIITLKDLINLLNGGTLSIVFKATGETLTINKSSLFKNKVTILINYKISYENTELLRNVFMPFNVTHSYRIFDEITVDSLSKPINVSIDIEGQHKNFEFSSQAIEIKNKVNKLDIAIHIDKKIVQKDNK